MVPTAGGPDDVLEVLYEHLEDTKKKHRRGTMTSHQKELNQQFGYSQIASSTENIPQFKQRSPVSS